MDKRDLELLNQRLKDNFGINTGDARPIWRVVWSDDEFEHRHGTYDDFTPGGLYIRTVTETRWVPKYDKLYPHRHVLEQLVAVPIVNLTDLPDVQTSYEPMWCFEDANGHPLPPKYEACEFVIHVVNAARGKSSLHKYVEPTTQEEQESRIQRINNIVEELWGDQSALTEKHGDTVFLSRKEQ
jgi:hypothetical protein